MVRLTSVLLLVLGITLGCEKTLTVRFNLDGTIKGKIITYDEFGYTIQDHENIRIRLEGSDPLISTLSDSTGHYRIEHVPAGTYNLIASAEGYGDKVRQSFQFVGGDIPTYCDFTILKIPEITIDSLSLVVEDNDIYLKGTVSSEYPIDPNNPGSPPRIPSIRFFIDKDPEPSGTNYLATDIAMLDRESNWQINTPVRLLPYLFSSGDRLYLVAYGCNAAESGYFDFFRGKNIYNCLGEPSEIVSITIP